MQVAKEKGFEKRAQYYASKAYISQANSGGEYHDLKEVIFLAISNFVMFPNKPDYKSDHIILDKKSHENDLKDFSFTFVELPKFNKKINQLSNVTEKWVYFFKNAKETKEQDLHKLIEDNPILERAYEELNRFSWNEEELLTYYDQAEKYEGAYKASMAQKYDEGVAEGIAKGKVEGIAEGERNAQIKFVENLLQLGHGLESIMNLTGLTKEEIELLIHKARY